MLYPDTIYPHGLLGYDGDVGEAKHVAADEFYLLLAAEIVAVISTTLALPAMRHHADHLHADEFLETVGDLGLVNAGGAVVHLTFLASWSTVVGVVFDGVNEFVYIFVTEREGYLFNKFGPGYFSR